jgi:hypothetical protein
VTFNAVATDFGDKDPEDAWDDGDPTRVKLAILERVVDELRANRDDRRVARRDDALRLVRKLATEMQTDTTRMERIADALVGFD